MPDIPWYQLDPEDISLEAANYILSDNQAKKDFPNQFNALLKAIEVKIESVKEKSKEANPMAWVQPSYEQALKLNAWVWGINYIVDFDANRIGKTAGAILNIILWLIPNQKDWQLFQPYTDHLHRTFKVLRRPPISALKAIRTLLADAKQAPDPRLPYDHPINIEAYNLVANYLNSSPPFPTHPKKRTIWVGGPDKDFNKDILIPEYNKWLPKHVVKSTSVYEGRITLEFLDNSLRHNEVKIIFKSYDSEDTKWAGAAVDGVMLCEGVPKDVFNEVRQRYKEHSFATWDYTPAEPRNTAGKSALAHKIFKDPTLLPLSPYVFSAFGILNAPSYILGDDKRADLIRMWENDPEGDARIRGIFYSSSPVVLKNYDPHIHALQLSFEQLRAYWHPKPLILFRGIDPGWGHVTACAWMALAPNNSRYIYKFYSRSQRSIEERCCDIITMSGNTRIPHPKAPNLWTEKITSKETAIKASFIDYHTFKTDEITKRAFSYNYINNGLLVRPSITYGPKERATIFNSNLLPQAHLPHPQTKKPPGSKIYFLINEEGVAEAVNKMVNLFWLTFEKGDKRGLTKDTVQDYDDDELDAACYVLCPTFNYSSFLTYTKNPNASNFSTAGSDARLLSTACQLITS